MPCRSPLVGYVTNDSQWISFDIVSFNLIFCLLIFPDWALLGRVHTVLREELGNVTLPERFSQLLATVPPVAGRRTGLTVAEAKRSEAKRGEARHGKAKQKQNTAQHTKAKPKQSQGTPRKARQGKAKESKAKQKNKNKAKQFLGKTIPNLTSKFHLLLVRVSLG